MMWIKYAICKTQSTSYAFLKPWNKGKKEPKEVQPNYNA